MKNKKILTLFMTLILIPFIVPSTNVNPVVGTTNIDPITYEPDAFGAGSKYIYEITDFSVGTGFEELLNDQQAVLHLISH